MGSSFRSRGVAGLASAVVMTAACAPTPEPNPPTQIEVTTLQTWCGGVIPPPGQPGCTTSPTSRTIAVWLKGAQVDEITTAADGTAVIEVEPGAYAVSAVGAPSYENCDRPPVTAIEFENTSVVQTCTIFAP